MRVVKHGPARRSGSRNQQSRLGMHLLPELLSGKSASQVATMTCDPNPTKSLEPTSRGHAGGRKQEQKQKQVDRQTLHGNLQPRDSGLTSHLGALGRDARSPEKSPAEPTSMTPIQLRALLHARLQQSQGHSRGQNYARRADSPPDVVLLRGNVQTLPCQMCAFQQ
ncbi:uncharacterized protein UV8b_08023 [Ustilaginoidea virens]|uniref:Uncharacterized protein n=1 Tax=Ustilaginoidea virens TaxID=1159556 RepID=A0A8E5MLI9_USTVR|nr:uncharacterized protein UV8b_08023 [Ustilaginoidea virens]QUC23782.1 hypothetical protein UV8b_08023 [Ustilaginoidea virens]